MRDHSLQKSWPHWLRSSVRALMIVVLLFACAMGWVVHRAQVQRDAVAAIEATGGRVYYNWQYKDGDLVSTGRPWAPKCLIELFGADVFGSVTWVYLGNDATESVMWHVGHLTELESFSVNALCKKHLVDSWLMQLRGLTQLTDLSLSDAAITDSGLAQLEGLTRLEWLNLDYTRITDAGLVHLRNLSNLRQLALTGTQVSDVGLVQLRNLRNLELLWIDGTNVTDAGIEELREFLPNLPRELP